MNKWQTSISEYTTLLGRKLPSSQPFFQWLKGLNFWKGSGARTASILKRWQASISQNTAGLNNWKKYKTAPKPPPKITEKELPLFLSWKGLSCQFAAQIAILVIITTLWILSVSRNGFIAVPDTPTSFFHSPSLDNVRIYGAICRNAHESEDLPANDGTHKAAKN